MWAFLTYSPHLYSTFNALFNIQLRIQHSTIHFIFNSFFAPSIIYSTISTIYSILKHSTIHSTFNSFEPSLLLVSDTDSLLVKNVAAARMPATKIEAYEDDTRLHFDVESGPPRFLGSVLQRTEQISQTKVRSPWNRKLLPGHEEDGLLCKSDQDACGGNYNHTSKKDQCGRYCFWSA